MKYKVGDKVRIKSIDKIKNICYVTEEMINYSGTIMTINEIHEDSKSYLMKECNSKYLWSDDLIDEYIEETKRLGQEVGEKIGEVIVDYLDNKEQNKGEISDGYHTFNELYEYRLLYNASMFNELAKQGLYDVHKSKKHSNGEIPFGDSNWFIVMAELPTGQISNHYEMKDWDLFQIPEKEKANKWDGHTPKDVAERIRKFLTPKSKYPTTYEECCEVVNAQWCGELCFGPHDGITRNDYNLKIIKTLEPLRKLLICRDAYWKIAGEEMGLGKPWEPDWTSINFVSAIVYEGGYIQKIELRRRNAILVFPTEEMRNIFYKNFKDLIEECKELL